MTDWQLRYDIIWECLWSEVLQSYEYEMDQLDTIWKWVNFWDGERKLVCRPPRYTEEH